jgi:hypothetical protein
MDNIINDPTYEEGVSDDPRRRITPCVKCEKRSEALATRRLLQLKIRIADGPTRASKT